MEHTTEVREGHHFSQSNLNNYLSSSVSGFRGPLKLVRQFKGGQSNPTFLLRDQDNKGYVLRKKPPGKLLPRAHDIKREYKVMKALQPTNVPVPHVYCLCEDEKVIGTAFYVMELVEGRIIRDIKIPGVSREERREIYLAAVDVVAKIGSVNIKEVGLDTLSRSSGDYYQRQLDVWFQNYQLATQYVESSSSPSSSSGPEVEKLVGWLRENLQDKESEKCGGGFLVHGDFRIDNLVFHPTKPIVLAVLDWELSALGHPYNDLASLCLPYRGGFALSEAETALHENEMEPLNIPTETEVVEEYLSKRHLYSRQLGSPQKMIEDWNFYLAFSYFRFVSIVQGVYARSLQGNASDPRASKSGEAVKKLAEMGLTIALSSTPFPLQVRKEVPDALVAEAVGKAYPDIFNVSERAKALYSQLYRFMMKHVYPMEEILYGKFRLAKDRWVVHPEIESMKALAKKEGLWNLWIPKDLYPEAGAGLTNLEYAPMAALMGSCFFASEVFNCSAPDTGNMEVLLRFGTPQQKKEWLQPLLEGDIRSCFGMTEPEVASSDARNIRSEIRRVGDEYIINGKKWWTSGAGDPRCKICIFMGKTYSPGGTEGEQSMILIPMNFSGVQKVRALTVFGYDDAPHGHLEVHFRDVRVPASNIIWGEGKGFAIAQARLGPGRIHHCMRTIGKAERCLGLLIDRGLKRETFGKKLVGHQTVQKEIADSRSELEQARLLTLFAASKIDSLGAKAAKSEIAMIKVVAPNMALRVIDRAIQVHGGAGVSQDFFLAYAYAQIRTLRLADGPDEVHRGTIAKLEIRDYIRKQKMLSKM